MQYTWRKFCILEPSRCFFFYRLVYKLSIDFYSISVEYQDTACFRNCKHLKHSLDTFVTGFITILGRIAASCEGMK
jgi:hypothetical protein